MTCKRPIIGIDFDNTITAYEGYPFMDAPLREHAKEVINYLARFCCIIIFTCREGKEAKEAIEFLRANGVIFMHFNENCTFRTMKYGSSARKIGCDVYIDDRSLYGYQNIDWLDIKEKIMPIVNQIRERNEEDVEWEKWVKKDSFSLSEA